MVGTGTMVNTIRNRYMDSSNPVKKKEMKLRYKKLPYYDNTIIPSQQRHDYDRDYIDKLKEKMDHNKRVDKNLDLLAGIGFVIVVIAMLILIYNAIICIS